MKKIRISLGTMKDVQAFVQESMHFKVDCDLESGRYIVDAKSIMGIYSLNLSEPVTLVIGENATVADVEAITAAVKPWTIE